MLKLLDLELSQRPNDFHPGDWLEYSKSSDVDQDWSSGRRLTVDDVVVRGSSAVDHDEETGFISTMSSSVNINFRSDDAYESRGFWLLYKGMLLVCLCNLFCWQTINLLNYCLY